MKKESKKLLERTALAEKDMKYGHNELMYVLLLKERIFGFFFFLITSEVALVCIWIKYRSTGIQVQHLAKSVYKVESQAIGMPYIFISLLFPLQLTVVCNISVGIVIVMLPLVYPILDLMDMLRDIPSREALALRAEVRPWSV